MASRILAFRPPSAVGRLRPRSEACPLSTRELLGPAAELGLVLPLLRAPVVPVARAVLLAARELRAAVGLGLPPGVPPEPWFEAVTLAADELAAGLPLFLSAEVVLEGEGAAQLERAVADAWRLVAAGVTHLAVDASAVAPGERGRIVAEVAEVAAEGGLCVELAVPLADGARIGARAARVLEELARRGVSADLASLRCPAPAGADDARLQAAALARLAQATGGVPVMRRGPVGDALLELLRGSPVKVCEDGGAAAGRALGALPLAARAASASGAGRDAARALEQAVAALPPDAADELEARAYFDALELLERIGAAGSAAAVAGALERRLEAP